VCAVVAGEMRICATVCVRVCEGDKCARDVCGGDRRVYEGEKCVFARERNMCVCLRGRETCGRVGEGVCVFARAKIMCVCLRGRVCVFVREKRVVACMRGSVCVCVRERSLVARVQGNACVFARAGNVCLWGREVGRVCMFVRERKACVCVCVCMFARKGMRECGRERQGGNVQVNCRTHVCPGVNAGV